MTAEAETIKRASGVFDEVLIRESLTVEGGDNNNRTSQFYGHCQHDRETHQHI